jgi:hypothetical protein
LGEVGEGREEGSREFFGFGEVGAMGEDVAVEVLDMGEEGFVDSADGFEHGVLGAAGAGEAVGGGGVECGDAGDLKAHHGLELGGEVAVEEVVFGDMEAVEVVEGDVDAAAGGVFGDIAEDVGELDGEAAVEGSRGGERGSRGRRWA